MAQVNWTILKDRAATYMKSCESLLATGDNELVQNALESAHLAVELALKSAIGRNGGHYPDFGRRGHDLSELVLCKFEDGLSSVLLKAKNDQNTSIINLGLTAWTMDCRYQILNNRANMVEAISDYKEFYIWIRDSFLS